MHFHQYLHKIIRVRELMRSTIQKDLNVHESTISKWLSNTRQPSASAIKRAIVHFHDTREEQVKALESIFFGDKK